MGANPGGRLHDDFSGPGGTKDIYVENFGSQPIYARVRLDEYMEIGIITRKNTTLTRYGRAYIDAIRQHI